jgi:hypothetical protein
VSRIRSTHHVLGVEHLRCQLWDSEGAVLLRATRSQRSESNHEKVQTREGNKVHSQLAKVRVELSGETEAASGPGHGDGNQMVEISVCGSRELQSTETDVIESFIVNDKNFISVFDELMD